ncbi:MAG: phosphate/phosphite/phosphonate ABC transporter substrate-binding protein [Byssovorax sp.]
MAERPPPSGKPAPPSVRPIAVSETPAPASVRPGPISSRFGPRSNRPGPASSRLGPESDRPMPIRVGVTVLEGIESTRAQHDRLESFCESLGAAIGSPVTAHGFGHYRDLLEAMHEGKVDVAWLPPVIALRATARGRTLPIALPIRAGTASFSSALFTRPGSAIKSPRDLIAVRAAWVDKQSAAGYLVIRGSLRAQGVDLDRAFSAESFLGSHEAVVQAVLNGAVDVGATFAHVDPVRHTVLSAGWGDRAVQSICFAGPIPSDVVAASIRLPVPQIRAVQRALCALASDPSLRAAADKLFGAEGFIEARPEHLDPLNRILGYLEDPRSGSSRPPPG